jgi:exopolysaccharide biosynthesis protein
VARALGMREALNLDGGGSTTMVARGQVVNSPSDATGERPVGDALLVLPRRR